MDKEVRWTILHFDICFSRIRQVQVMKSHFIEKNDARRCVFLVVIRVVALLSYLSAKTIDRRIALKSQFH